MPVARVVSTSLVPPAELSPEMEVALGVESRSKPMSVAARQEKLLEKLNLDGLAHWAPENAVVLRELVLAYHDVFALESNQLGCTSTIKHEIHIENSEPFKGRVLAYTSAPFRGGMHLPQGYVGSRGNSPEPIPLVQCGCLGLEERRYSALLHGLQMPQCTYEEGLVPFALHPGGLGKHGGVSTFLINGFQVGLLANQDGFGIPTVHSLHGG